VVVTQGDVCWADLPEPVGSGPGFRRPVLVVQGNAFNRSRILTVLVVPLTSNLRLANAPGNVVLPARASGLSRESVANVSQLIAVDRDLLSERVGHLSADILHTIFAGIDLVLGRERLLRPKGLK
jgi:mRNA interferase MazF